MLPAPDLLPATYAARPTDRAPVRAQDNKRAENAAGPSSEWWHGLFVGEDTLDTKSVSVQDYVSTEQLGPEQRKVAEDGRREQLEQAKAEAEYSRARQSAKDAEEKLKPSQKEVVHPNSSWMHVARP